MHQWMGDLFYRGAHPQEIECMTFGRMKYWHGWHALMARAESDAARRMREK